MSGGAGREVDVEEMRGRLVVEGRQRPYIFLLLLTVDVSFSMKAEVIAPAEATITMGTLKRFLSGMLPDMPGQLVAARELPRATLPLTDVRLLPGMCPPVCL